MKDMAVIHPMSKQLRVQIRIQGQYVDSQFHVMSHIILLLHLYQLRVSISCRISQFKLLELVVPSYDFLICLEI